jgi:hypothetical protein
MTLSHPTSTSSMKTAEFRKLAAGRIIQTECLSRVLLEERAPTHLLGHCQRTELQIKHITVIRGMRGLWVKGAIGIPVASPDLLASRTHPARLASFSD